MEIYKTLTKEYLEKRLNYIENRRFKNIDLLRRCHLNRKKSLQTFNALLDSDLDFSFESKEWIQKVCFDNSLGKRELSDWIGHIETHAIKLKERLYFLLIFAAIFTFIALISKTNFLPEETILIPMFISFPVFYERLNNMRIQSSLEELTIYIRGEVEILESKS